MNRTQQGGAGNEAAVLEAITQWACHHKLDSIVNATIATMGDVGLTLSNETEARYSVLLLKQKIVTFSYNTEGVMLMDVLDSFVDFVSAQKEKGT